MKFGMVVAGVLLLHSIASADPLTCTMTDYRAVPGLSAAVANDALTVNWDGDTGQQLRLRMTVDGGDGEPGNSSQFTVQGSQVPGWYSTFHTRGGSSDPAQTRLLVYVVSGFSRTAASVRRALSACPGEAVIQQVQKTRRT